MSIQSEINRITSAKASIVSAITAKGGTVPTGASIDDLPSAVASIPTSGGGSTYEEVQNDSGYTAIITG